MAADVVETLLPLIRDMFDKSTAKDTNLQALREKIRNGAEYSDVYALASMLAEHCSDALLTYIKAENLPNGKLYYNIARRLITPQLQLVCNALGAACSDVQRALNEALQMQLNPLTADFDTERADNLALYLSKLDTVDDATAIMGDDVENFSLHYVDETIRQNAEFLGDTGVTFKVTRTAHAGACKWCQDLADTYDYDDIKNGSEVWQRHRACRCTLEFNPEYRPGKAYRIVWQPGKE